MFVPVARLALLATALGVGAACVLKDHALFTWLFIDRDWSEEAALRLLRTGSGGLVLCALLAQWPRLRLFWLPVGLWCATLAAAQASQAERLPWLVPFTKALVWLPPLGLALLPRTPAGRAALLLVLRVAASATFLAHGLQAILLEPAFLDYLFMAARRFGVSEPPDQETMEGLLLAIGLLDVVVAVLLLVFRSRAVAFWMAFWGFLAAGSRIVHAGGPEVAHAWTETLERTVNGGIPLAVALAFMSSRHR